MMGHNVQKKWFDIVANVVKSTASATIRHRNVSLFKNNAMNIENVVKTKITKKKKTIQDTTLNLLQKDKVGRKIAT
jgi:hypothetical protein